MLETCRRLRRLCRKRSDNVVRHDKTPVKSTFLSPDKNILSRGMSFMTRRSDIMVVTFAHLKVALHALSVRLLVCSVATYDIIFWCRLVYYKTLIL